MLLKYGQVWPRDIFQSISLLFLALILTTLGKAVAIFPLRFAKVQLVPFNAMRYLIGMPFQGNWNLLKFLLPSKANWNNFFSLPEFLISFYPRLLFLNRLLFNPCYDLLRFYLFYEWTSMETSLWTFLSNPWHLHNFDTVTSYIISLPCLNTIHTYILYKTQCKLRPTFEFQSTFIQFFSLLVPLLHYHSLVFLSYVSPEACVIRKISKGPMIRGLDGKNWG